MAQGWARSWRLSAILLLGFASGLPLMLTVTLLQAWMREAGINLTTIGLFNLVALPYTLKFLWAPLLDRYALPFLGRRRGWMLRALTTRYWRNSRATIRRKPSRP